MSDESQLPTMLRNGVAPICRSMGIDVPAAVLDQAADRIEKFENGLREFRDQCRRNANTLKHEVENGRCFRQTHGRAVDFETVLDDWTDEVLKIMDSVATRKT